MLNIAIVGCGAVVDELHVLPFKRLASANILAVTALVDRSLERAKELGKQFRSATAFKSLEDAGQAGRIDLTLIASPPGLHAEHAIAAFRLGSHVLCEKPMTIRSQDADRMIAAAAGAKRILAVGMTRRFYPNLGEVANLLKNGELGKNVRFTCREGGMYGWQIATDGAFRRESSGGGVLMDKGVHVLDSLCWLFGEPRVLSCRDDALRGGVEANSLVELAFPKADGLMQLSWDQPLANGLHIVGDRGEVRLEPQDIRKYLRRSPGGVWRRVCSVSTWPAATNGSKQGQPKSYYDCFDYQLVSVVRAVTSGDSIAVDGVMAARVIRALEEAYAMAKPMPCPWLSMTEQNSIAERHWRSTQ